MKTKVASAVLTGQKELASYFDENARGHDWCGPKVALEKAEFFVEFGVYLCTSRSGDKPAKHTAQIVRSYSVEITNCHGKKMTKSLWPESFKDRVENGVAFGWLDEGAVYAKLELTEAFPFTTDDLHTSISKGSRI